METLQRWRNWAAGVFCVVGGMRFFFDGLDGAMFTGSQSVLGVVVVLSGVWLVCDAARALMRS